MTVTAQTHTAPDNLQRVIQFSSQYQVVPRGGTSTSTSTATLFCSDATGGSWLCPQTLVGIKKHNGLTEIVNRHHEMLAGMHYYVVLTAADVT
jgi:2-keto-3-deoxy-6-phosphogluconate aldolase